MAEEEEVEPEETHPMPAIPQSHEVPPPQAFPYITRNLDPDSDDVQVIARTPFGSTLVQQVCHGMSDMEAHEAVISKNWYRQVADAEASRLPSKMPSFQSTSYDQAPVGFAEAPE